ncbi:MAG: transposase, partial [Pseudomonadales bacterium]
MKMRDELGTIYHDELFAQLYPGRGRPVQAPWRLALVTVMQFAENLTDRQAADAVRARIDWKYALSLELDDPGFDFSLLSDFRARLLDGGAEELLFEQMLELFKGRDLLKAGGRQRTDSTHIIASVRALNRLELVGETLLHALNEITQVDPVWLKAQVTPDWFERYASRFSNYRLPKSKDKRQALAEEVGADGWYLLGCIYAETIPAHLRAIPAVETLRRIWVQQFYYQEDRVRWRDKNNVPPAAMMVASPYDVEVRYSHKRGTEWRGYKVHLTETCDADQPHLITHVETTAATEQDGDVVVPIHEALARKAVVPKEHLVDRGYPSADLLVESQQDYGIDLVGPMRDDQSWQARTEGAFEQSQFQVDWQRKVVILIFSLQQKRQANCNPATRANAHALPSRPFGTLIVAALLECAAKIPVTNGTCRVTSDGHFPESNGIVKVPDGSRKNTDKPEHFRVARLKFERPLQVPGGTVQVPVEICLTPTHIRVGRRIIRIYHQRTLNHCS